MVVVMGVLPAAVRALGRDALVWRVGVLQAQAAKVVSERKARAAILARRPRLDRVAQGHSPRTVLELPSSQLTWLYALQNGTSCPRVLQSCASIQHCAADSLLGMTSKPSYVWHS
jgi:hypothetical protein